MSAENLLRSHIQELCPTLTIDTWAATDSALAKRVTHFVGDVTQRAAAGLTPPLDPSNPIDRHARYLAEEICLDSFQPDRVCAGISQYLRRYVVTNFPNDPIRLGLIDQICHEANTHQANLQSRQLQTLLTTPRSTISPIVEIDQISLKTMKAVDQPTRFGDILFLPREAEMIIVGDTHGDLASTQQIIRHVTESRLLERGGYVIFLGDYVHNGLKSWANLLAILTFQQQYPDAVFLLNGNHEFRESYLTALNEYFRVHWEHFTADELPPRLQDRQPQSDNHYGHLRLDLIRNFGFVEGENIYSAFVDWSMALPCICISNQLMISHSLGKLPNVDLTLHDLLLIKQQDADFMRQLGYETWQATRPSLHAALINNRTITPELLQAFHAVLDVNHFVVGHCHYRSGDTVQYGDLSVTTVVSSAPYSPDAGRYMYQQMVVTRAKMRSAENLTEGDAVACYLRFWQDGGERRKMTINRIRNTTYT